MIKNISSSNNLGSKGVYISTYGCQMNVNDSERMYTLLEMANYQQADSPDNADLIIINSCSVREKPVHKVHSEVGRYRKLKEKNPRLRIGVSGCVAQQEKDKLLSALPVLDFVFGPDNIDSLPSIVAELEKEKGEKVNYTQFRHRESYNIETYTRNPGVATFVNITKGCDNFCTFCVVPFTRGRERSRNLKSVIEDINRLVTTKGVKEVTLLGQNVNSYESECGADFGKLLETLCLETDLKRIRYTTSHPKDFNEDLVKTLAKYPEKLCKYIHLPMQSGNSEVLARMNRGYTREEYCEKIKMIKSLIPDVSLSTDIIVGFPGETEEQFMDTVSLMQEVAYETIFAFKYSPRPLTKAARFDDQVAEEVKSRRLNFLFEKHHELAFALAKRYENQTLDVLVEKIEADGTASGRTTHNKLVHFIGSEKLIGQIVPVRITRAFPVNLRGELVQ
jgi:tRNA-2-methylthio-N6-dimethylallyladenosine synthase